MNEQNNNIENFMTRLASTVRYINGKQPRPAAPEAICEFLDAIQYSLENHVDPRELRPLEYLNEGSYKVAFTSAAIPGWVVKFAYESNASDYERELYDIARRSGFVDFFPETIYLRLPVAVDTSYFDEYDQEEYWESCTHLVFQPLVTVYNDCDDAYTKDLPIPEEMKVDGRFVIDCEDWAAEVYQIIGKSRFCDFVAFLAHYRIFDLHGGNVGFSADGTPVILDWFSDHS